MGKVNYPNIFYTFILSFITMTYSQMDDNGIKTKSLTFW